MKKILCVIITCICLSVPMVAQAEPTVFIDGEVAQEGSGGIIDLSKYVNDVTAWAVGFVTNYNWSTGVDVVNYVLDNLTNIKLESADDDSYIVSQETFNDINNLVFKNDGGYLVFGAKGTSLPSHLKTYLNSNTPEKIIFVTSAYVSAERTDYTVNSYGSLTLSGANLDSTTRYSATYRYDSYYASTNPIYAWSVRYQRSKGSGFTGTYNFNSTNHTIIVNNMFSDGVYMVGGTPSVLGSNSLSPQAFTPMTPTQISNVDYESWYDNKYDNSITVNNAYNYYNTIVAPEPQEVPTLPPYDVNLIYNDVNTNLTNYSNGLFGLPVSVDMLGMGFITATYLALPSAIQNLILLTLTLALAMVVTGVASFVARRIK